MSQFQAKILNIILVLDEIYYNIHNLLQQINFFKLVLEFEGSAENFRKAFCLNL